MKNKLVYSILAVSVLGMPQDEYFKQQWYLKNTGYTIHRDITEISSYSVVGKAGADIHFPFELQVKERSKPVVVAILDHGVDIDHPELKDSILRNKLECDSLGHLPPKNSPDKDGNGYKGDCAGWNFASASSADGDNQVYDDVGHGTHIAGLIAAKIDQYGIRGISDQIKILPVKIFSKYEIPNHPLRPKMNMMERIQKGLEYAISKNVDIINISAGWPSILDSKKTRDLFDLAAKKNILVVAAAGNNAQHTTIFPCSYASVICVGATTVDGTLAPFSNYGGNVDILAPGENILSTIPKKITSLYFDEEGYDFKNGTSQAAPLVAGSAALLKLQLGDISVNELKARLLNAAAKHDDSMSALYGDLNVSDAIYKKPDQFLYPNLKELNAVEVGYPDGRFNFDFKIDKLLPGPLSFIQLKLNLGSISLDQNSYGVAFGAAQDTAVIHVSGRVADFHLSSTQVLSLDLSYGANRYSFKKELTLALNAEQVGQKSYFSEKINADNLHTADDPFAKSDTPVFYTQDTTTESLSVSLFRQSASKISKFQTIVKKSDIKLVAVSILNKNELAIEFYDQPNKKLIYEFWDLQQNIKVKTLEMVPDSAVFSMSQAAYFSNPSKLQATVLTAGSMPPLERNKSVFLSPQTGQGDHFYFFEEQDGKIVTELLDNECFRNAMTKQYHLRFDDDILPLAILSKGSSPQVDTLVVIGKGYDRRVLAVRFSGRNGFTVTKEHLVPGGAAIKNATFLGKSMLVTQEQKGAYLIFDLESGTFTSFEWHDTFDDLMGPIVALSANQVLAQTQNNFVVLGSGQSVKIPLKRFSFLPGELFSEMFAPVEINTNQGNLPGLFIDGTLISEKHLGVVSWDGKNLVKPIFFQEKLPENCKVMNPQRISGAYSILLFCQTEQGSQYLLERALVDLH